MRRYDDPVEVRRADPGAAAGRGAGAATGRHRPEAPEQFLWRGRLWKVRTVVAHWVETGAWWQSGEVRAALGVDEPGEPPSATDRPAAASAGGPLELIEERELWRVEAGRGGRPGPGGAPDPGGVFDLAFDCSDGRWSLVGCAD